MIAKPTIQMKQDIKLAEEKRKSQVYCPHCHWKNHIYSFEGGRKLCKNCRRYIYKDNYNEFKFKMKEVMNKCKSSN